jgi:hypothetical protein
MPTQYMNGWAKICKHPGLSRGGRADDNPWNVTDPAEEPVHLSPSILRSSRAAPPTPPPAPPVERGRPPTFSVARRTDNELILFDESATESWIVYPPRSVYEFLSTRRRSAATTVVEHHPWTADVAPVDHPLDARDGCLVHGLQCRAQLAIAAAVRLGYDPFS